MTALTGATAAYVSGAGKPLQSMPALSFTWDGAATPTLTVTVGAAPAVTYSGQAMAGFGGVPQALLSAAAPAGNSWGVGPA